MFICVNLWFLFGCQPRTQTPVFQQAFLAFDTIVTITITDPLLTNQEFESLINGLKQLGDKYELLFNKYNTQSDIAKLQYLKPNQLYPLNQELYYVLKKSQQYHYLTQGLYDITIGRITGLYNYHKDIIPNEAAIKENLKYVGMDKVILTNNQIMVLQSGIQFDLGNVAKGYIIDKFSDYLKSKNINNFIVKIGGDLYASGKNSKNQQWSIGIQDPKNSGQTVGQFFVSNQSVTSSGDYERYTLYKNKKYHHILNPFTGLPVWNQIVSVTIIGKDAMTANFLALAVFLMGQEKGITFIIKNFPYAKYIIFMEQNNKLVKLSNL